MYRRVSKGGKTYFTGKLGYNKVALVQTSKTTDDGVEIWSMLLSEVPKETEKPAVDTESKLDDEMPF